MAGYYSKKKYDCCDQRNIIDIETGPGTYKTLPIQTKHEFCNLYNTAPNVSNIWQANTPSNLNYIVDIESHLKNLDIPDSKCLERRTLIDKGKHANELLNKINVNQEMCNRVLEPNYSRYDIPTYIYKEKPQTRIEFPIIDPRVYVYNGITNEQNGNNRFGVNTRLQVKDMSGEDFNNKIIQDINNLRNE
jgi:hypothetical protein